MRIPIDQLDKYVKIINDVCSKCTGKNILILDAGRSNISQSIIQSEMNCEIIKNKISMLPKHDMQNETCYAISVRSDIGEDFDTKIENAINV